MQWWRNGNMIGGGLAQEATKQPIIRAKVKNLGGAKAPLAPPPPSSATLYSSQKVDTNLLCPLECGNLSIQLLVHVLCHLALALDLSL